MIYGYSNPHLDVEKVQNFTTLQKVPNDGTFEQFQHVGDTEFAGLHIVPGEEFLEHYFFGKT